MATNDFANTSWMGDPAFADTTALDAVPYVVTPPAAHVREQHRFVDDGDSRINRREFWAGFWIIAGVLLAVLIGLLPQFKWFQDLTAISSWIEFLRNLFGTTDVVKFIKNMVGQ